jgi:polysaccharide export outer membrane protein
LINRRLFLITPALAATACVSDGFTVFPVTAEEQRALPENVRVVRLNETNIQSFAPRERRVQRSTLPSNGRWDYRVGVNDILSVIVFDHPELTLPAGPQRSAEESGFRVQADGTFFYPFIGQVRALGRAPEEIRSDITRRLSQFIPNPQLEVRVAAFNSQSVLVTGEVKKPARLPLTTVPLTVMDAITAAEGMAEQADARRVTIQRDGVLHRVDLHGLLKDGVAESNPLLRHRDLIHVPPLVPQQAFVLGEIQRPDVIDLSRQPVTLTHAIARQGGLEQLRADARGVFVFRDTPPYVTVYQLETSLPTGWILGTRFALVSGDVVYVVRAPAQTWNDVVARLLPTITAVRLLTSTPSLSVTR